MPYIIDESFLVCALCSQGYDQSEISVEYSVPLGYPDGYTCDICARVYSKVGDDGTV